MKTIHLIPAILITALSMVSCQKETDNPDVSRDNFLQVNINGEPWSATSVEAAEIDEVIQIVATDPANSKSVTIVLPEDILPGTYPVLSDSGIKMFYTFRVSTFLAETGSITIDSIDPDTWMMTGKFSFIGTDLSGLAEAEFTNGSFQVVVQ